MEVLDRIVQLRAPWFQCLTHRDFPEDGIHRGRQQFPDHGAADNPEEMKRLQLGKDRRRQQGQEGARARPKKRAKKRFK